MFSLAILDFMRVSEDQAACASSTESRDSSFDRSVSVGMAAEQRDLRTRVGYVKRLELYRTVKPYCLNIPVFPDGRMHNIEYEYIEDIPVIDIRDQEHMFNLDAHGFQLLRHETQLTYDDFTSVETIYKKYFPECESFLRDHLGASRVFAFEHQVRKHQKGMEDNPVLSFHQPLTGAHCGMSHTSSIIRRLL